MLFAPSASGSTWISWVNASASANTANITWRTSVPADSQVEYGPSTSYGSRTSVSPAMVTNHSVAVAGLSPGTTYHFRVLSHDSDAVAVTGRDLTLTPAVPVSISMSPSNTTLASSATQQLTAVVSNSANLAVTWKATPGP